MENTKKMASLTGMAATVAGVAGFFLRMSLYGAAVDHKGMLVTWHPLTVCLVLAGLVSAVVTLTLAFRLPGKSKCSGPSGVLSGVGSILMALGLVLGLAAERKTGLSMPVLVLAGAAAAAMVLAAVAQFRGRQPYFLCHALVSLFMAALLIGKYQVWRQTPQLMDFAPALLAVVMMMLYSFQLAQASLSQGSPRSLLSFGGLGIFLCLTALSGGEPMWLYLGGAGWMITGLLAGPREGQA